MRCRQPDNDLTVYTHPRTQSRNAKAEKCHVTAHESPCLTTKRSKVRLVRTKPIRPRARRTRINTYAQSPVLRFLFLVPFLFCSILYLLLRGTRFIECSVTQSGSSFFREGWIRETASDRERKTGNPANLERGHGKQGGGSRSSVRIPSHSSCCHTTFHRILRDTT